MKAMTEEKFRELDQTICTLNSMGKLLSAISLSEGEGVDLHCFADMGNVISLLAIKALDLASEMGP